jgi:hypothetical protein
MLAKALFQRGNSIVSKTLYTNMRFFATIR